ncbi:hypothetical protein GQ43DRAFT_419909 [Delitschia confertaspora ATCC 74209]|uniref:Cellulase (Glycosyl hydrolase family 5) n=1 Tax=Delitschia confertaspora ATCC 74209 TaxID=1513339 RepID=A0A9P4JHP2_9PLEO|nr:hypothetical protein GQ43DRAFT_419909 [Delitschia confertaspora ATCC 74209]
MYFPKALTCLISLLYLSTSVLASLRITADHHSFGGVNYPSLQYLEPTQRDEVIQAIVNSNARVIRLFIRGDKYGPDPETGLGIFNHNTLDQFDDILAAIYRIGKGTVKVIIAPHDAHALRGSNDVLCDVYCEHINEAFLDFYSNLENRKLYKDRLTHLFTKYRSKNFNGATWNTLKDVIMGVDLQNEPWSGVWPIVAGEAWLCDIATHLKETIGLGANNIAVITGGLSGPQMPGGTQNFPDSAFECDAIDVIAIHGYYAASAETSAGTNWANMFLPGNTLTSRALGKKLLLVEEMSYIKSVNGIHYKKAEVWDQGNALNYRGIPWLYSKVTTEGEGTSSNINILFASRFAIGALKDVLTRAFASRSNFDWSRFLAAPKVGLSNLTHLALNPFIPNQSPCTFGCPGWLCDAADGCEPDLVCRNSVCQKPDEKTLGFVGKECDGHRKLCHENLQCIGGVCEECTARETREEDKELGIKAGSISGTCSVDDPFRMRPICQYCDKSAKECRGNPCLSAQHCDADEYCDWGVCKTCTSGCLGMSCKSSSKCKTGYCNVFGKCDYPKKPKRPMRPEDYTGRRGPGSRGGLKQGPSRPMDNVVRVNIPKEGVIETGGPVATATGAK